jgi:hypothetical protein
MQFSTSHLLKLHCEILDELRSRDIVRSSNNPVSDYAELLFCKAFSWTRKNNSSIGYDACDANGLRYQIKGRRITPQNRSRQLSAIRGLPNDPFDHLAGVLFDAQLHVTRAAIVPLEVIKKLATHQSHTNSWRFLLRDIVWDKPGVIDVTDKIQIAEASL